MSEYPPAFAGNSAADLTQRCSPFSLILRSLAKPSVSKDEAGKRSLASWFETALMRLLSMRNVRHGN
jgi:hypothetical protein